MAANPEKKAEAERRAREIYERLMSIRPEGLSNNQWTAKAGVSTSFFTNMQGTTKAASEPSIGNLRAVLKVAGSTLPEFFLDDAEGRLMRRPTRLELERALDDILDEVAFVPPNRQALFVAQAVLAALGLGERDQPTQGGAETGDSDDRAKGARVHPATN